MSTLDKVQEPRKTQSGLWLALKVLGGSALVGAVILAALLLLLIARSSAGNVAGGLMGWLLSINSVQATWYVTRSAGLSAYFLLWLSTAWGLAVSNRILDGKLHGTFTYDFHQFISLLAIGFMFLHVIVLYFDQYLPFSIAQILVPFTSSYRPLWVGIGITSFYIILLVTVTFYLRGRIGSKAFRSIHVLSLLGFVGAAVHGLFAGTDSPLPAVQFMYAATFLSVVFLTAYWLAMLIERKKAAARNAS